VVYTGIHIVQIPPADIRNKLLGSLILTATTNCMGWISVDDVLPFEDDDVLLKCGSAEDYFYLTHPDLEGSLLIKGVTHWMEIPH
jgi:hypothetical protein